MPEPTAAPALEAATVPRAVVRVAGRDAEAYLQGQLSQDVGLVGRGEPRPSFLLEPTGKVAAVLRVQREAGDSFLLDTDEVAAEALLARLRRFLLRTQAIVEPVEGWACARFFGAVPGALGALVVPVAWPPGAGPAPVDVLGPGPVVEEAASAAVPLAARDYQRRRIAAGLPVSGVDAGPDTIPAELGQWLVDAAVSFTKGCYTGQELVARIDSRGGNVPRPLRVVRAADGVELRAGDEVRVDDGGEAVAVGVLTSAAGDVALGPLARRVAVGDRVEVGGHAAVVER